MIAACITIATVSGSNPGLPPVASFDLSNSSPTVGEQIQLTDTSQENPTAWSWTVNGELFSQEQNPVFYCDTSGYFTFELTATNQFGSDTASQQIFVSGGGE